MTKQQDYPWLENRLEWVRGLVKLIGGNWR